MPPPSHAGGPGASGAPDGSGAEPTSPSAESRLAFLKAVKFWLALLLAFCLAAALLRVLGPAGADPEDYPAGGVSYIR